jgi:ribosome-associated protein
LLAAAALEKKARDIVIMDMRAVANITDYFVISSAPSTRRVATIANGMEEALLTKSIRHGHIEGKREALWVLIDYGDVIAHVFHDKTREFYNLERLWSDAPKERFSVRCISARSKKT